MICFLYSGLYSQNADMLLTNHHKYFFLKIVWDAGWIQTQVKKRCHANCLNHGLYCDTKVEPHYNIAWYNLCPSM